MTTYTIEDDAPEPVSVKRLWLFLLKEGGRWNVSEVAGELGCAGDVVSHFATQMSRRGYLTRFPKGEGRTKLEYAVDKSCKVPHGMTMHEIAEATKP